MYMCKLNKANCSQRVTVLQNIEIYKVCFIDTKMIISSYTKKNCDAT